ncbi:MAG: hypothetical protein DMG17_23465 [Acidobacteria bacterium]|nr:MAG: hypothetical protein DMG17_23465 [Acidobacteriota bacterium]
MFRPGDRVRVRWLVQSDCLGLTGTVLDVQPSVFLGRDVQWCRVDFGGRQRRVLSIDLVRVYERSGTLTTAA